MRPTFTLTFTVGTSMQDILDSVLCSVLEYTRGNRIGTAGLLQINARTIFPHLGTKATPGSATRGA
jgi:hypothetical protein